MAKYCIANIFVLLGLARLASGLAWPALLWVCLCPLSLTPSLPLCRLCFPLDLFNFLFLLLLFCSALFRRLCQSQSCEAHLTNELCSCFKLLPPTAPSLPLSLSLAHTMAIKCVNFLADNRFYFWHGAWHNPKWLQPCGMYVKRLSVCVCCQCVCVCVSVWNGIVFIIIVRCSPWGSKLGGSSSSSSCVGHEITTDQFEVN